jgi:hypothetical protein
MATSSATAFDFEVLTDFGVFFFPTTFLDLAGIGIYLVPEGLNDSGVNVNHGGMV